MFEFASTLSPITYKIPILWYNGINPTYYVISSANFHDFIIGLWNSVCIGIFHYMINGRSIYIRIPYGIVVDAFKCGITSDIFLKIPIFKFKGKWDRSENWKTACQMYLKFTIFTANSYAFMKNLKM